MSRMGQSGSRALPIRLLHSQDFPIQGAANLSQGQLSSGRFGQAKCGRRVATVSPGNCPVTHRGTFAPAAASGPATLGRNIPMIAASYFHDGYTQSGFIAAMPRMHGALRFHLPPGGWSRSRSQLEGEAARQLKSHFVRSPRRGVHQPAARARAWIWSMCAGLKCPCRARRSCACSPTCSSSCTRSWPVGCRPTSTPPGREQIKTAPWMTNSKRRPPVVRSATCARSATQKTADGGEAAAVSSPAPKAQLRELPHLDVRRSAPGRHPARRARPPSAGQPDTLLEVPQAKPRAGRGLRARHGTHSPHPTAVFRNSRHGWPRAFAARGGRSTAGTPFGNYRCVLVRQWEWQQLRGALPAQTSKGI